MASSPYQLRVCTGDGCDRCGKEIIGFGYVGDDEIICESCGDKAEVEYDIKFDEHKENINEQ